jgi:hypothetical protein
MRRYALHLLFAANAALAFVLAGLWFTSAGALRNAHWQAPLPQKTDIAGLLPVLPNLQALDTSQFLAVLERPVFSATRRPPPPPPPVAAQAPTDNLSTARLSGIVTGPQGSTVIMNIAGKDRRVRMGDAVEGWTLQSIEGRGATFVSGGQVRALQLPRANAATYTGAPLPVVPPAPSSVSPAPASAPPQGVEGRPAPPANRAVFGGTRS